MFEALFILTTLDAGTRVGRYLLQDMLGNVWRPLADTKRLGPNLVASSLIVAGWGYFLLQGVHDPLGGINSLWPLFGIANQLLSVIALCLATTIILKMELKKGEAPDTARAAEPGGRVGRPVLALVTLVPLVWLLAVTMSAGVQKIWNADPRVGFLAQANELQGKAAGLEQALAAAKAGAAASALQPAERALRENRVLYYNNLLDAVVAGVFLALVLAIVLLSLREWALLLGRRKLAVLRESQPVWLPDYALAPARPVRVLGLLALAFALAKELSGEAHLERAQRAAALCECTHSEHAHAQGIAAHKSPGQVYVEATESRYTGVRQCC